MSRGCPVRPHADHAQHFADVQTGVGVIIRHKRAQTLKLGDTLRHGLLSADGKAQRNREFRALPRLTLDRNTAAHHIDQIFRNRHAETGSLNFAHGRGLLARKLLEDMLLKRRAHADAGITDMKFIIHTSMRCGLLLNDAQGDHAAYRGELDGIGQDVKHDLVETHGVGNNILILHIDHVDEKRNALGGDVRLDDIAQIVYKLGQVHRAQLERNLAALDTAHIKYIVDEREQMLARRRGLFQVVEHLLTVVDMGGRK